MENTLTETQKPEMHIKTRQFVTCALMVCALFIFGCEKSLRKPVPGEDTFVDGLLLQAGLIVREGLADADPRIRANAVEVVAATGRIELMPKVQRLLKDEFVPVRFAAVLAVGDTEYRIAKDSVERLLKDPDENIKIAAAYSLSKLGNGEKLGIILDAVTSKDQTVRANAAVLLGKSGDKSAVESLYRALRDENSDDKVRLQAAEAIARLGDEQIYPRLWTMLISVYADDRVMGIRAMGALGTTQAKNALITMLDDGVLEVRLAAAEQLGMLKDTAGEPEVLDVFGENLTARMDAEGRERVYVLTALAIGRIGTASLTRFLPQLLENESKLVRIAAARAVFQCRMAK